MRWCSGGAEIALCLALSAGCAGEEVFETQVLAFAETEACREAAAAGATVNAYRVRLLEFQATPGESDVPCGECLREGRCPLVDQVCACGTPRPPRTVSINRQLEGLRFDGLDPGSRYCVAVIGFELPELAPPTGDETVECPCDFGGLDLTGTSRLCGGSPFPGTVGENAPSLLVQLDCPARGCPFIERMDP